MPANKMDAVKYREINLLNYWISAFFLIQILVFYAIRPTPLYIDILKYEVVLFYGWCFLSMYGRLKFMSLYFLFLFSFGLFILSRVFLDILGEAQFEYAGMFFDEYFSLRTQKIILSYILFFLIALHAGALAFAGNRPPDGHAGAVKPHARLEKFGLRLLLIYLPVVLAKIWIQFSFVLEHGYLAIFSGEMQEIDFPFWMAGASSIFDLAFVCILIAAPARKKFITIALIYLFIQLFSSLIGGRGKFILSVLFVLWYYYKVFDLTFKVKNILYLLSLIVVFSQTISAIRVKDEILPGNNLLYRFLYEQGNSVLVLGHMVNYRDEFVNTGPPYLWGGFHFISGSNTVEHLQRTNSLASELTYFLSPRSYL
ncbi:MAG: O-antigen polysaccharide polymerase Wzy, partial [Mangrovibacterium sp.]|nr:O-antigen polysaccharide polymerase Wzy [Mangrovibacterium sp.]